MKRITLAFVLFALVGCQKKISIHPGAVSNLDSYAFDLLLVEQDVLAQARVDYLNGRLPEAARPAFNAAASQYNITQAAWQAYHSGHAANDTVLQDALNALVAAVGQLQQVLGKKPVPIGVLVIWQEVAA